MDSVRAEIIFEPAVFDSYFTILSHIINQDAMNHWVEIHRYREKQKKKKVKVKSYLKIFWASCTIVIQEKLLNFIPKNEFGNKVQAISILLRDILISSHEFSRDYF